MDHNHKHLVIYLNDHLAGSETAINVLDHLKQTDPDPDLKCFVADLCKEVMADRLALESLMHRVGIEKHPHRTATAWLAERVSRLKLWLDDSGDGLLHRLEALELVEIGIEGKRALWRALAAAAQNTPVLQGVDFNRLIERASEQHDRVETVRLVTAKTALAA
jgi:hypothetical protein